MNTLLSNIALLFRNTRRSIAYGSIAIITVALEELFENVVFKCPCNGHFAYGLAFLWAPVLVLFLCGILVDTDIWKLKRKSINTKPGEERIKKYYRNVFMTLDVMIRAALGPVAWLVVSFLQEQYYTCAFFGPPLNTDLSPASSNSTHKCHLELASRTKELEEIYRTHSQLDGWSIMLTAVVVFFVSFSIRRCNKKRKHLRIPSEEYYRHVEAKAALEEFHAKAKEIGKETGKEAVRLLFQGAKSKDFVPRIREVGKVINDKYGLFLVIPPESPAYRTPESGEAPQFPMIPSELMTDGPEHSGQEKQLRRVPLLRQEGIDAV